MRKKKTIEEIKETLLSINSNIEILDNIYINNSTKLHLKCKIDNYEWMAHWNNLSHGKGCPKCSNNIKLSLEDIKERLKEINPNIEILSDVYINNETKLKCKCLIDGYEWNRPWTRLSQGLGCPKCSGRIKLTIEEAKEKLREINPSIEILSNEHVNTATNLKCKCLIDNNEWNMRWGDLLRGRGCPKCGVENRSGENHYLYNSNLTDEERNNKRDYKEYIQFIKDVLKRDNYTCCITGKKGCRLIVHHLNGYNWDVKNRININNAVSICEELHKEFHSIYGSGNNTEEQFIEFILCKIK